LSMFLTRRASRRARNWRRGSSSRAAFRGALHGRIPRWFSLGSIPKLVATGRRTPASPWPSC
jgi:hypothetical protein